MWKASAGQRAAGDLGEDRRTAPLGMLGRLDHEDAGRLAEDEAVAVRVERARGAGRVVVALRQRAHVAEGGEGDRQDGALRAPGNDHVDVAVLDQPLGLDEGLDAGGAGGHAR